MTTLVIPIALVDDTDEGQVEAVTAADNHVDLAGGLYKIAAMGQPLMWKVGDVAIVNSKGSYLAPGDQELVRIPAPVDPAVTRALRFIRAVDSTADGNINITKANLYDVPGVDAAAYEEPIT